MMGQEDTGRWGGGGGVGEAMTRHTLDLQGKRDEKGGKDKEEEMEAAYLDWRKQ
jgi:hypothetical protein